jgi:adenine-specific DNA-methyltransferase
VILVSSTEATEEEPDKNVCRDVCATRVRRVIEGYGQTPGLGGDFAYLRCRRIEPARLIEIEHEQVWTALQLTHCPAIGPFDESRRFMQADYEDGRLIYVPHFEARDTRALKKAAGETPCAIVYSWQAELVRQRLEGLANVDVQPIPQTLARRFGLRL